MAADPSLEKANHTHIKREREREWFTRSESKTWKIIPETITKNRQWKQEQFFHHNITFFKIGFCILSKTKTKKIEFCN